MVLGSMMSNMATVLKPGKMVQNTMENIRWGRSMAQESTSGMMDPAITASGIMEIFKASEITHGPTEGDFKDIGIKIKCMVVGHIIGEMVELMQAST